MPNLISIAKNPAFDKVYYKDKADHKAKPLTPYDLRQPIESLKNSLFIKGCLMRPIFQVRLIKKMEKRKVYLNFNQKLVLVALSTPKAKKI